jgi:hypothetical protein
MTSTVFRYYRLLMVRALAARFEEASFDKCYSPGKPKLQVPATSAVCLRRRNSAFLLFSFCLGSEDSRGFITMFNIMEERFLIRFAILSAF